MQHAALLAQAVIDGLGQQGPPWIVLDVRLVGDATPDAVDLALVSLHSRTGPRFAEPAERQFSVTIGPSGSAVEESVAVYFPLYLPVAEAIVVLASQIQDHAIETAPSWGLPLPPCPGHSHPLSARIAEGAPVWQCPTSSSHHQEPIVGDVFLEAY